MKKRVTCPIIQYIVAYGGEKGKGMEWDKKGKSQNKMHTVCQIIFTGKIQIKYAKYKCTMMLLPDSTSAPLKFLAKGMTCSPTLQPCSAQVRSEIQQVNKYKHIPDDLLIHNQKKIMIFHSLRRHK